MKMLISRPNDRSILFHARLLCKRRIKRSKEASLLKIHGGKNLPVNDIGFFFQGTVFCRARSRWQSTAVAAHPDHSTARRPVPACRGARSQTTALPSVTSSPPWRRLSFIGLWRGGRRQHGAGGVSAASELRQRGTIGRRWRGVCRRHVSCDGFPLTSLLPAF